MPQALVLVVEDDVSLRRFLEGSLQKRGYRVLSAATGAEAEPLARSHNPDLVLLDLGLPDMDGVEVLESLRVWSQVPVVILSARHQERQKVRALDLGADDYLTKPFGMMELLARIRVALRHVLKRMGEAPVVEAGTLRIDLETRTVSRGGVEVKLTPLEFKLLAALVGRGGKVATHHQLLSEVWGPGQADQTHYLHICMGKLRQKLEEDPTRPAHFVTEVGVGYRLRME